MLNPPSPTFFLFSLYFFFPLPFSSFLYLLSVSFLLLMFLYLFLFFSFLFFSFLSFFLSVLLLKSYKRALNSNNISKALRCTGLYLFWNSVVTAVAGGPKLEDDSLGKEENKIKEVVLLKGIGEHPNNYIFGRGGECLLNVSKYCSLQNVIHTISNV